MTKWIKKCLVLLLVLILALPATSHAAPSDRIYSILNRGSNDSGITNELILKALHKDTPKKVKIITSKKDFEEQHNTVKTNTAGNDNSYINGLDISKWNGDIDWKAVKKANIQFVIIRAGYGTNYVDPYFKSNIKHAIKYDIMIGVYWFSYSHTYQGAKLEAEKCYKTIKPYKKYINLPVFWDFEYDSVNYANKHGHSISKKLASGMADTFCTTIKNKGLQPGIYTNIDYSNRYFSKEVLSKYHTWIAQWTNSCTYKYQYIMWQCSDSFYIKNKKFDLNRLYYNRYNKTVSKYSKTKYKTMKVSATAYCGDSITSTMIKPHWGVIAADPSVIPYGSIVYIEEFDKYFVVEDCGGAIKGKRIDIFMNSEKDCREWGVRKITIKIVQ